MVTPIERDAPFRGVEIAHDVLVVNCGTDVKPDSLDPKGLVKWAVERTVTPEYNDQKFNVVVANHPMNNPDHAIGILSPFATGYEPRFLAMAHVIWEKVDSTANLFIIPSSTLFNRSMNFSKDEREKLRYDRSPYFGRIAATLSMLRNPNKVTFFGASQGTVAPFAFGASEMAYCPVAVAALDIPNLLERSVSRLVGDFVGGGQGLQEISASNFENPKSLMAKRMKRDASAIGLARYAVEAISPDNRAMIEVMRHATAVPDMAVILSRGGSIVQAWTDSEVSPARINQAVSEHFKDCERYKAIHLEGFDHSAANSMALAAQLTLAASQLAEK